ncbi:hypothetical protein ACFP1Z_32525 [Streptomyces gamaensis]|uniref:Uncharacterized protein n=1 Tax=Streptomyces gamaensis TaxID=1763542 RepID=A0ABW0ZAQ1_9ACTN
MVSDDRSPRTSVLGTGGFPPPTLAENFDDVIGVRAILSVTGPDSLAVDREIEEALAERTGAARGVVPVWVRPQEPGGRPDLVRALYSALGLGHHRTQPRTLSAAEDLIAAELRRTGPLLIVSGAHVLGTEALYLLYRMWSVGVPQGFPLVLAGDERLGRVLWRRRLASLDSCVYVRHRLSA